MGAGVVPAGGEEGILRGREEGREEGRAEERALLLRLTARRFGTDTAEAVGRLLEGVDDTDHLAEVGEMIVDCRTGGELLDRVRQEPGRGAGRHPESNATG